MAPLDGLAKVWILLQTRIDSSSIVREIIGHFALASLESSLSAAHSFSFFVWMKVIYDLQHTYSQSSDPSPESLSYLLPLQILFTTIHHVLETRSRLYSQRGMDGENLARRYFVARVLLSGLRALQLRAKLNESLSCISAQEINEVSTLVQTWWEEAEGIAPEQFMLTKCQNAISQIRKGPGPNSVWHKPASGTCAFRDNRDVLVCQPVFRH
jgi:hypothetical protein